MLRAMPATADIKPPAVLPHGERGPRNPILPPYDRRIFLILIKRVNASVAGFD
jgi:hypothetical protein